MLTFLRSQLNSHENRNDCDGHKENLREGNQSQNIPLLEFNQRNQQASTPPTVLAQHLQKRETFAALNVPQRSSTQVFNFTRELSNTLRVGLNFAPRN